MADDQLLSDPDGGVARLLRIMARLRDRERGCPWDIEQDFASIAPYTIEEAYEVVDAIERGNMPDLQGELGDLLLQVVFHAQMAQEAGHFDFEDVVRGISDKMLARHPHVFGDESREKSAAQQTLDWEEAKAKERAGKGALEDVALGLPALLRALKLQKRAARVGFDWESSADVLNKLQEEVAELLEAQQSRDRDQVEDEFGDLLFVMVNLARHMEIDPEHALRRTNSKFLKRFRYIEARLSERGKTPKESSLQEMDALWNEAKTATLG